MKQTAPSSMLNHSLRLGRCGESRRLRASAGRLHALLQHQTHDVVSWESLTTLLVMVR